MKDIIKDKVVLITGGTGFLGRSLIREILKYDPHSVRIFSRDEVKHHKVQEMFNDDRLRNFIGDVRDYNRLEKATRGADYVIHAAALKRLDLIEYNVEESIKTNVLGTTNIVRACLANNVKKAVFVSSDKACSPVNTYGATKFVGERIFTESNFSKGALPTVFTCVRYGNVLDSTGSVIPFFIDKIKNDNVIPLTDKRMTRFIISDREAVDLIRKALKYSLGGEVFIPKLPSFQITDLIEVLCKYFKTKKEVKTIGIRPGEKIHELMINDSEASRTYDFKDMYVIVSPIEHLEQGLRGKQVYVNEGKKLPKSFKEYSSADSLISKDEILKILKEQKILTKC